MEIYVYIWKYMYMYICIYEIYVYMKYMYICEYKEIYVYSIHCIPYMVDVDSTFLYNYVRNFINIQYIYCMQYTIYIVYCILIKLRT